MKCLVNSAIGRWFFIISAGLFIVACKKTAEQIDQTIVDYAQYSDKSWRTPKHTKQSIHDNHCISCHDAAMYGRLTPIVHNAEQLSERVSLCNYNLAKGLSVSELLAVSDYLKQHFYQF